MRAPLNLLSAPDAAKLLRVHPKTVSHLLRVGKLPGLKVANRWVVDDAALSEFRKTYVGKRGRPKGWSPKKEGKK